MCQAYSKQPGAVINKIEKVPANRECTFQWGRQIIKNESPYKISSGSHKWLARNRVESDERLGMGEVAYFRQTDQGKWSEGVAFEQTPELSQGVSCVEDGQRVTASVQALGKGWVGLACSGNRPGWLEHSNQMGSGRRQFLKCGQMQLPKDLWAMKRNLDFILKCDGKPLEGFKQRSDITLLLLKETHCGCCVASRRE